MSMIIVEVAIGVAFLYLLLSLIVTTAQEAFASLLRLRAQNLYESIADMLGDEDTAKRFFNHGLIRNLTSQALELNQDGKPSRFGFGKGLPSYIPSRTFAIVLLDVLRQKATLSDATGATELVSDVKTLVEKVENPRLKEQLRLLIADAEGVSHNAGRRAAIITERVEGWFNDRMERTSGWYRRNVQIWSLVLAALVAIIGNADSVYVVQRLWRDGALRESVAASAQAFYDSESARRTDAASSTPNAAPSAGSPSKPSEEFAKLNKELAAVPASGLPIGWTWNEEGWTFGIFSQGLCARPVSKDSGAQSNDETKGCSNPENLGGVLLMVFGWLATALAVSLGANFWFQMLGKVLQLRGTGGRPDSGAAAAAKGKRPPADDDVDSGLREAV